VERAPAALKIMRANLAHLGLTETVSISSGSVGSFLRRPNAKGLGDSLPYDLVFLDPPYDAEAEYALSLGLLGGGAAKSLAQGAMVIAEHRRKERLEEHYGLLRRSRLLEQGDAALSFYRLDEQSVEERLDGR
jgi:16S rRNA G966 N2-methylase RsmD